MAEILKTEHPLFSRIPPYVRQMVPYRPGKPIEELKEEYGLERIIKLASNENPFGASPMAIEAATAAIGQVYRYPDPVSRKLRRKIAHSLGITPEEIVLAAGSETLLDTSIRSLMTPEDVAVTGFGAFMGFEIHLAAHGGRLVKVPSPDYRFDVDALIAAVTPETRILYLPNPNNPTGTYLTTLELDKLLTHIPPSTLILLDEAYIEYCGHLHDYPDSLAMRQDNVLILRTFSKAYGLAGLRIGYAIGHPIIIEQLAKVKMTFDPSMPAQLAAEAAWDDREFLARGITNNRQELERYYHCFDKLGLKYLPSAGNFIFVEMDSEERVNRLNQALLQRGIAIRPLAAFGFPDCVRITIGRPDENDVLFEAFEAILPGL